MTINDLEVGIISKLAGRTDLSADIPRWTAEVSREFSMGYPFTDLEVKGPTVAFIPQQYEYDTTYFLNPDDEFARPVTWIVLDTNNTPKEIKYRNPQVVEPLALTSDGRPGIFSRVGLSFIVAPTPDTPYTTWQRYQRKHPFSSPPVLADTLYFPDEWKDILEYAIAQRAALDKRMIDYASNYHTILFGDPKKPDTPGLIFNRTNQRERDSANNERRLIPRVQRYGRRR
jgi:hypothetical protein